MPSKYVIMKTCVIASEGLSSMIALILLLLLPTAAVVTAVVIAVDIVVAAVVVIVFVILAIFRYVIVKRKSELRWFIFKKCHVC